MSTLTKRPQPYTDPNGLSFGKGRWDTQYFGSFAPHTLNNLAQLECDTTVHSQVHQIHKYNLICVRIVLPTASFLSNSVRQDCDTYVQCREMGVAGDHEKLGYQEQLSTILKQEEKMH